MYNIYSTLLKSNWLKNKSNECIEFKREEKKEKKKGLIWTKPIFNTQLYKIFSFRNSSFQLCLLYVQEKGRKTHQNANQQELLAYSFFP